MEEKECTITTSNIISKKVYMVSVLGLEYIEILDNPNMHLIMKLTRHIALLLCHLRHIAEIFYENEYCSLRRSI